MPFDFANFNHLQAATGYCELGMYADADAEIDQLSPEVLELQEVLAVKVAIYQSLKDWDRMQDAAEKLVRKDPDNVDWIVSLAYSTRRALSMTAARAILEYAVLKHPDCALLHYNLACYACQSGETDEAKDFLATALELDHHLRFIALEDEDLQGLWKDDEID